MPRASARPPLESVLFPRPALRRACEVVVAVRTSSTRAVSPATSGISGIAVRSTSHPVDAARDLTTRELQRDVFPTPPDGRRGQTGSAEQLADRLQLARPLD
jgi:hypothetical protein